MAKKERFPELEIGDPFKFFEQQAVALWERAKLPLEFVPEAIAIIKNAFGEAWLREQVDTKTRATPIPFHSHPLGGYFAVSGESQIVEVLELAIYLKKLVGVPNLEAVIRDMKTGYGHGFLQLAFAHRLKRVGAEGLELEPPSAGGRKADLHFKLEGEPYLLECYIPRQTKANSMPEMHHISQTFSEALGEQQKRVRIYLKRTIDAKDRKIIQAMILREIKSGIDGDETYVEGEAFSAYVEKISLKGGDPDFSDPPDVKPAGKYKDADIAVRFVRVESSELEAVRLGQGDARKCGRLFVWRPAEERVEHTQEERLSILGRKLSRKLSQARRSDSPRRMLVASIPEAELRDVETKDLVSALRKKLVDEHKLVAGVFLVRRVWSESLRFHYVGYYLGGNEVTALPQEIFSRIDERELDDILDDWK